MKKTIILNLCILLMAATCKEAPPGVTRAWRITLYNNTKQLIVYSTSFLYPDTTLNANNAVKGGIQPHDFTYFSSTHDWEKVFQENNATKLSFFFFSPDTISKYGWDDVRTNYRVLKRKDFTLQELKDQNYTVSYP